MEFDIAEDFAQFLIDAIDCHLDAFPEYRDEADNFLDLFSECVENRSTLHLNF